jgi:mannose-1-phosphate guanylyltransferase
VLAADVGWSDIGSWSAVYDLLKKTHGSNLASADCFTHDAEGNYFHSQKFVAAIGVNNLVLVETDDAILLCPRDRAQDVGKIVKYLEEQKRSHLL